MPDKPKIVNRPSKRIAPNERTAEITPSAPPAAEVALTPQAIAPLHLELAEQALSAVIQAPPSPEQQQSPHEQQREAVLQAIVEARLKERAPTIGTLGNFGGVQVANQTQTREEATVRPDLAVQEMGVHFMTALRDMDTREFQENIDRVAATRNLDRGGLATRVNDLVAIMTVSPPELQKATDFADSNLLVPMTDSERKIVDRYESLTIAEQGYNLGIFAADPQTYAAFKARLTPEEQLAMQVTAEEGLGIWRAPARTQDSVANLVLAAPIHAPAEYLEVVDEIANQVLANQQDKDWKDKTKINLEHAADRAVRRVVEMMDINTYQHVRMLKNENKKSQSADKERQQGWAQTVKDKVPKKPGWLGKEREAPQNPADERIKHAVFSMKAVNALKEEGLMADRVRVYLTHDAFGGHKVVWDEASNQLVSHGRAPDVEEINEKDATQVFREVVIPLAFANGAGSEKEERAAQLHVGLSQRLRDMVEAHHEANPKVRAQQVERTVGVLGSPERPSNKQQLALQALNRGQQTHALTEAIANDPEQRARRGLDPKAPEIPRHSPKVIER